MDIINSITSTSLLYSLSLFLLISNAFGEKVFNVQDYGAQNNDKVDNAIAFTNAWKDACAWSSFSRVYIPKGTFYLSKVTFYGPCNSTISFTINGVLLAPPDSNAVKQESWIDFENVDFLTVDGGGTLDGQGSNSWSSNNCNKTSNCRQFPSNISFKKLRSSSVNNLRSINSKMGHFKFNFVSNFNISNITITTPEDSPNTDGIKISDSTNVTISNINIKTGDDCIAILSGNINLDINNVNCGPGHGISIGSLGKYDYEKNLEGIKVRNVTFTKTSNGVRIKTYAKSVSKVSVSNVVYENIEMIDVQNPIVIDQNYCPNKLCDGSGSGSGSGSGVVEIKEVKFSNIYGTSTSKEAYKLKCSESFHCQNVELRDINITYNGPDGPATALCENVNGSVTGKIEPADCKI